MVKKKGLKRFDISNRLAYTLMVILSIALLGIGVYAAAPNPGHSANQIGDWPACGSGQVLGVVSGALTCVTPSATDSRFSITTNGLCYNAPATCGPLISAACTLPIRETTFTTIDACLLTDQSDLIMDCTDNCLNLGVACNGDISTTCSGGTTAGYTMDSVKCGPGSSTHTAYCYCSPVSIYSKENYVPAGQRCI